MLFELKNATQTFQRFMNEVLNGLNFYFAYIDDENEVQHQDHLQIIFQRLSDYGLTLNSHKSVFGEKEVRFLEYMITAQGTTPGRERVAVINNFK